MAGASTDGELFGGAPFLRLFARCRLVRAGRLDVARRIGVQIAVAWVPLAVLTIAQDAFLHTRDAHSFLLDVGVHARFIAALPLFVLAERVMAPRLAAIAQHFLDVGIVTSAQRPQFDAAVSSTRRLVHSQPAEIATVALGYALVIVSVYSLPLTDVAAWHLHATGDLSWAGWWHAIVSLPMLLIAFLGFVWRWWLWSRLLWRISRLDLAIIPVHPDGVAGLRFVSYSVRAFALHGLALGVIISGAIANRILYEGASATDYSRTLIGILVFVTAMFSAPLVAFS